MNRTFEHYALAAFAALLFANGGASQSTNECLKQGSAANHSQIAYAMYSESRFKDAAQCGMRVSGDHLVFDAAVTNPALTCPDMFAWKLFVDVVKQEFWANWAADQQTWPGCSAGAPGCLTPDHPATMPLPLCAAGSDPAKCCNPQSNQNPGYNNAWNPAEFCPYFPGDHRGTANEDPIGEPLGIAHFSSFAHALHFTEQRLAQADPSRSVRQTMSEIVFRNKPMWQFVFDHNLYNQEGLVKVLTNANANLSGTSANPPYRDADSGNLVHIDFPVQSIMIKSDWLNEKAALEMGLKDTPPHIKMEIRSPVTDNNGTILQKGVHWLVSFHVSSKDTPNWVWATFEHVANPGRCDYTGCNDSFGYTSPDATIGPNQLRNYTAPKMACDNLPLPSWVFDTEKQYEGGQITPKLAAIFRESQIGTGPESMPPSPVDPRWLNYRLKGSQVDFSDAMGRPTRLANSVTEAGFTNSSSCITCHARASIGPQGTIPLPNGVFVDALGDLGYGLSANGSPNPNWFQADASPPAYRAIQADFVWGVLTALCIDPKFNPIVCQLSQPAAPTAAPTMTTAPEVRSLRDLIFKGPGR